METTSLFQALPNLFNTAMEFANDVYQYWQPRFSQYFTNPNEKQTLKAQLSKASNYEEWHDIALRLDHSEGNDVWRTDPASSDYDYRLIALLVFKLEQLRRQNKVDDSKEVVRSGLIRNMGSIATSELYTRAYAGTKTSIEDYINSVEDSLEYSSSVAFTKPTDYRMELRTFFRNARQSYGRTALVLHGGSVFGSCHLGVVKSSLEHQLLPSVVCGASVGAIVAAYISSSPPTDIADSIANISQSILPYTDLATGGDLGTAVEHVHRTSFSKEVSMFFEFVSAHLGTLTFEEAYLRSGIVLNILVLREGDTNGMFYNYLTTPKVIIRSAVLASIGSNISPGHYNVTLLVKDYEGRVCRHPDTGHFFPANHKTFVPPRQSPYSRLAESFNVNNYIVSVSRPYFAPILLSEFKYRGQPRSWHRIISLIRLSAQYRIGQLADWGLSSPQLKSMLVDEMIPGGFQVNVVPESDTLIRDSLSVFDSTDVSQKVQHWINLGVRSVWPQMSIIWARTKIEYVLEESYEELT